MKSSTKPKKKPKSHKMAKGYWIANGDVNDMEVYKKYIEENVVPFEQFGGSF